MWCWICDLTLICLMLALPVRYISVLALYKDIANPIWLHFMSTKYFVHVS